MQINEGRQCSAGESGRDASMGILCLPVNVGIEMNIKTAPYSAVSYWFNRMRMQYAWYPWYLLLYRRRLQYVILARSAIVPGN